MPLDPLTTAMFGVLGNFGQAQHIRQQQMRQQQIEDRQLRLDEEDRKLKYGKLALDFADKFGADAAAGFFEMATGQKFPMSPDLRMQMNASIQRQQQMEQAALIDNAMLRSLSGGQVTPVQPYSPPDEFRELLPGGGERPLQLPIPPVHQLGGRLPLYPVPSKPPAAPMPYTIEGGVRLNRVTGDMAGLPEGVVGRTGVGTTANQSDYKFLVESGLSPKEAVDRIFRAPGSEAMTPVQQGNLLLSVIEQIDRRLESLDKLRLRNPGTAPGAEERELRRQRNALELKLRQIVDGNTGQTSDSGDEPATTFQTEEFNTMLEVGETLGTGGVTVRRQR